MKRITALLLCILAAFLFPIRVSASEADDDSAERTFSVSIYNSLTNEYILENQILTSPGISVFRTITLLKERGQIYDCVQGIDRLLELSYYDEEGNPTLLRANDAERFFVELNGALTEGEALLKNVRDGDIVEWIYDTADAFPVEEPPVSSLPDTVYRPTEFWTEQTAFTMTSACDWLNRNPSKDGLYLAAMGSAGRSADVKTVNALIAHIRNTGADRTAAALAQRILSYSYCGFDAESFNDGVLLNRLMETEQIAQEGLEGAVSALLAYDCRGYKVPNAMSNSRGRLIAFILECKSRDGGFSFQKDLLSSVDATAAAITALSSYMDQPSVKEAVDGAVAYLVKCQLPEGGFASPKENSESLSMVIIALSSVGIGMNDERFMRSEETLLDELLEYFREDGGFSRLSRGESSISATEKAVLALSAVKRGGNPFKILGSAVSSVSASPQGELQTASEETKWYLRALLVLIFLLSVCVTLMIAFGRRRRKREAAEKTADDYADT